MNSKDINNLYLDSKFNVIARITSFESNVTEYSTKSSEVVALLEAR